MIRWTLLTAIILPLLCCATPSEGDRRVNDQTKKAGAFIEAKASEPEIKQAGRDVRQNSETLEKNLIGTPKETAEYSPAKTAYSPEVSAGAREQSTKDHSEPWWKKLLFGIGGVLLGSGGLKLLTSIAPRIFGGPAGAVASTLIEGIFNLREKSKEAPITEETLLGELMKVQMDKGLQPLIASWVKKIEAKLKPPTAA